MNSEKIFLALFLFASAYSVIITILLLSRNATALRLEEEAIYDKADREQIAQALKEIRETNKSSVKSVAK